mmetsp:Transcript_40377/g.84366  ORF Transcript_40377/g.84366 Transcript_40377/m.84366 type:complete len:148 (-) Transcript_40377:930-1373(-)
MTMKEKVQSQVLDCDKLGWAQLQCFQAILPSTILRHFETLRDVCEPSFGRIENHLLPRLHLGLALKSDLAELPFHYTAQTENVMGTLAVEQHVGQILEWVEGSEFVGFSIRGSDPGLGNRLRVMMQAMSEWQLFAHHRVLAAILKKD